MIELAKVFGIMEKELEYDMQWSKGLMLYEGFENTTFNDENYSEYDAIVNYLKSQSA